MGRKLGGQNLAVAMPDHGCVISDLNRDCFCITLEPSLLREALAHDLGDRTLSDRIFEGRPHLFSSVSVFVSDEYIAQMHRIVSVIERIAQLPSYRKAVAEWAPEIGCKDPGPAGAFMGYDFHLGEHGPKLIEINTNAGGALLNAVLARAQTECCGVEAASRDGFPASDFDAQVAGIFRQEWRRQRGTGALNRIAIVDDDPEAQYLYPEFVLAQALLQRAGFDTIIADPSTFSWRGGKLMHDGQAVDLVYNRLVDFDLSQPKHVAIRCAYLAGGVVLTPNPHLHARLADKRNLALLGEAVTLSRWGVLPADVDVLVRSVPKTVRVTAENAAELWTARRKFFFKPAKGHGSKAAYRGAKLTRGVWNQILEGEYVAQLFTPPSERMISLDGAVEPRKLDVRLYTYASKTLVAAARLYKGQTTNFRSEGGGFAPVLRPNPGEICAR